MVWGPSAPIGRIRGTAPGKSNYGNLPGATMSGHVAFPEEKHHMTLPWIVGSAAAGVLAGPPLRVGVIAPVRRQAARLRPGGRRRAGARRGRGPRGIAMGAGGPGLAGALRGDARVHRRRRPQAADPLTGAAFAGTAASSRSPRSPAATPASSSGPGSPPSRSAASTCSCSSSGRRAWASATSSSPDASAPPSAGRAGGRWLRPRSSRSPPPLLRGGPPGLPWRHEDDPVPHGPLHTAQRAGGHPRLTFIAAPMTLSIE